MIFQISESFICGKQVGDEINKVEFNIITTLVDGILSKHEGQNC